MIVHPMPEPHSQAMTTWCIGDVCGCNCACCAICSASSSCVGNWRMSCFISISMMLLVNLV